MSILVVYTDPDSKSAPASASSSVSSPIEVSTERAPTMELTVTEEEKAGLLRP